MVMPQLDSIDHAQQTKTLICALNLVSRDLPLPHDLFHTVSSIYNGAEGADTDAQQCGVRDDSAGGAGSDEKTVDRDAQMGLDGLGNSRVDLLTEFEDAILKQRPNCLSGFKLKETWENRYQSLIQHRLNELEELPSSRGEDLQTKCLLELYGLKLAEFQRKIRSEISSEYWLKVKCAYPDKQLFDWGMMRLHRPMYGVGDPFSMDADDQLRKKRDAERLSRLEEEEKNLIETKKRKFFAEILNAVREFQLQLQASLKRRKQRNDGIQAWHGRQRQRATRAEKLRFQALKADDQEAYMRMVKESKNERLTLLLEETNKLLVNLGAAVQRQKDSKHLDGIEPLDDSEADLPESEASKNGISKESPSEEDTDMTDSDHNGDDSDLLAGQRQYNSAIHSIQEKVTEQPSSLQGGELRSYQIEGLQWMLSLFNNNLNGILADEMGLGKTIQTISLIAYLMEYKGVTGPHLIVAPKAVLPNWINEFSTWVPSITTVLYDGRLEERKAMKEELSGEGKFNVLITHYDLIMRDKAFLKKIHWYYLIVDEGHRLKNHECALARILDSSYHIQRRLLLTGTPIQNSLQELWSLLNFLLPNIFNSVQNFEDWFNAPFADRVDVSLTDEEQLLIIRRLHQVIRPFILRRKKDEVEKYLPSKSQVILKCDMSAWQKVYYHQVTDLGRVGLDNGGNSKTLMIVNLCPNASSLSETLSSLNFSSRARSSLLSLGNRDTIKKWRDIANDARKELYEKEKEIQDLKQVGLGLKQALKDANDQCVLLFNEVHRAWKVSSALQTDLKSEHIILVDKHNVEKEQNAQLRNQVAQLLQFEQEQKLQIQQQDSTIQNLQAKIRTLETQLDEALRSSETRSKLGTEPESGAKSDSRPPGDGMDSSVVTKKLEEELKKRDALIERLHEENEKLFDRLTEKASLAGSPQLASPQSKGPVTVQSEDMGRNGISNNTRAPSLDVLPSPLATDKNNGAVALVKSGSEIVKTTPAGEYLTAALNDFDPDQYDSLAAIADGANKLLMLVLAAVIKAGASREHEILAEIRDAVFSFLRKMEPKRVMDTMLVSRVRILYIRSLLARSPELQSIKVLPVEYFLDKPNTGRSRSSSRGSSPGRSPVQYYDEQIHGFKVNLKPEKKSKFSSVVLKIRGIDQDTWRQQVTGVKLREITEEAKSFAIGNKSLAAVFVHTPAGELQRHIRSWLAENFEFLSVTGNDTPGGSTGQLELLSTAIMDGWMAGLGAALPSNTDALGQLLYEYSKRVYTSQLQHLKDIAGTLATEEAEDASQVAKLRSALESVDHKRRKILQQMRSDVALLTLEGGGSPIQNPSTAVEDARLASLISLDGILKQTKEIMRQSNVNVLGKSKKRTMLASLDELTERMPSLLEIDHPCAQRQIAEARRMVESIPEEDDRIQDLSHAHKPSDGSETDVAQWNVLQFNTGTTSSFIIKCGANSNSELVIKADARVQEPKGGEIVRVAPRPSVLENMSLEEMKQVFSELPDALSLLALARTADGTRARYSRLYRTLAMKVPSLRDLVGELEKGGALKDVRT